MKRTYLLCTFLLFFALPTLNNAGNTYTPKNNIKQLNDSQYNSASEPDVPISEIVTLTTLYDNTLGDEWTDNTNWLDTINHSVSDWFGITVENGHVTRIELPDNNLQEGIFGYRLQLPQLEVLDLSGNNIMDANFNNLDSLSNLTSLHIENNNFIFKHIIEIQNLPYYDNFSGSFSYAPQGKIDFTEELELTPGDILEMSINPYFISSGDLFQWHKNDSPLEGETNYFYDKINIALNDSGTYYLTITNPEASELILQSYNKYVTVKDIVGGVPREEYEALVALYNATDGDNWTNKTNWLDITNHTVADWYGVTVTDGQITGLNLYNNNLSGEIPDILGALSKLQTLLLSKNQLYGSIPNSIKNLTELESLALGYNLLGPVFVEGKANPERAIPNELSELVETINVIDISSNKFFFNDIEPFFSWHWNAVAINAQFPFDDMDKTLALEVGVDTILKLENYLPGEHDQYQWIKDGNWIPGANDSILHLNNVQISDEGGYKCLITNTIAQYTSIYSNLFTVQVNGIHGAGIPLLEYKALEKFYTVNDGENWVYKENWLDTVTCSVGDWAGVWVEDGHVKQLALDSVNVAGVLPEELKNLTFLEGLFLFDNNISGDFPSWIGELSNLVYLSLGNNNLSGELPSNIGLLNHLKYLEVGRNQLEGNIPPEIGNAINLEVIFLDRNLFTGNIPEELGNLIHLRHLNLEHNNLTGTIPANLGNLSNLRTLDLSNNQLVGPLPVELKNFEHIYRFDIDNNLIGEIDLNKSATADNNRQIPDELADLIQMDTLYLGGNKLQFNDIEAIFSWENSGSFNEFIYAPQDSIGVLETRHAYLGDNISLTVENYFPGPSDKYRWYKNGNIISGENSVSLDLTSIELSDAGEYYCKITNPVATELTLTSRKIIVEVSEKRMGAGVPLTEYEALVDIYNNLGGIDWINSENWLDTLNHSVNEWYGVTVENGKVTALDLSGLNLEGNISAYLADFDSLTWLDLSNNNFSGPFTSLFEKSALESSIISEESTLDYLNISSNKFTFADLEPNSNKFNSISEFIYAPQSVIGSSTDTSVLKYQSIELIIHDYFPGEFDSYTWFKEGEEISNSNQLSFLVENATLSDSGKYTCQVSNSLFPDLILYSDTINLSVLIPDAIEDFDNEEDILIYPNPGEQRIFIDTGNEAVNIKIYTPTGVMLLEKDEFKSDWIDVQSYTPGIYIFKIKIGKSEVISRKVIFK